MIRSDHTVNLFVARHAEAQKNIEKRHGGGNQTLTALGIEQARDIGYQLLISGLVVVGNVRVVHQPEERSRNTAVLVNQIVKGELIEEEPDFQGIGLGTRVGMSEDELAIVHPDLSKALNEWVAGKGFNIPSAEGSEPMEEFAERITRGLHSQVASTDLGEALAIVGTTSSLTMINHILSEDGEFCRDRYLYYGAPLGSVACWEIFQNKPVRLTGMDKEKRYE
jgi:broad specificity phosphatase PhoE